MTEIEYSLDKQVKARRLRAPASCAVEPRPRTYGAFQTGVITSFGAGGYGFIAPEDGSSDVFFHEKECFLRKEFLHVGDRVEFEVNMFARRGDGKRTACEVRVINAG
jgi:cold shock CspA family protein